MSPEVIRYTPYVALRDKDSQKICMLVMVQKIVAVETNALHTEPNSRWISSE